MPYSVDDQWSTYFNLAGVELPVNPSTINHFHIITNIHQHLPSMSLGFKDTSGITLGQVNVGDGAPVQMYLGDGSTQPPTLDFITSGGPDAEYSPNGVHITINGVLNAPAWGRKTVDRSFPNMNSHEVIEALAGEAGLSADIMHTMKDRMTWLPNLKSIADYANFVSDRAYGGPDSASILAVTEDKKVRFGDISQIVRGSALTSFGNTGKEDFPVFHWKAESKTGFYNNFNGYAATTSGLDFEGNPIELTKVALRRLSDKLGVSTAVQAAVDGIGRFTHIPIQSGNTHADYPTAKHQNARIRAQFSHDVSILTDRYTGVKLLDLVEFNPLDKHTGEIIGPLAGAYIVSAKTMSLQGRGYLERLTLTSQSSNTDPIAGRV